MCAAYYNEIDPYAAAWLRNLIAAGRIAPGDVDERSIADVQPDDLTGYSQAHFFAGIGGWPYALRLAGWSDDRPVWTGSCPCQPFSIAGSGAGSSDERHLWPVFFALIAACRPPIVMGEQVAAAVGKNWLDGVSADLEGIGYTCGAAVVPACAVDAPHRRDRLWFVADADKEPVRGGRSAEDVGSAGAREGERPKRERLRLDAGNARNSVAGNVADTSGPRLSPPQHQNFRGAGRREEGRAAEQSDGASVSAWGSAEWFVGRDGKARRTEPGVRLLAHGVPARVGRLRAYGNAIVPQVAAEVIGAYMDARIAA